MVATVRLFQTIESTITLNVLYVNFLIVRRPNTAVRKIKCAQAAASDPKKRRPTRISEREIDLERAAERESEMAVRPMAPWLTRLTPIVRPSPHC
jgi:hypothetical protein